MFYHDDRLQYEVEVEEPNPVFAKMLQQAIGGVEGEIRVAMQYMFQAWAIPDEHAEYRAMVMDTAAEELGHIEMLATAVSKNLEGSPLSLADVSNDGEMGLATLAGMQPRQILSTGLNAMPVDSNGVPFNGSWVVASGNLAADMYANIMAESTGRLLATRLHEMTDDPGMKDMLEYLIARDTMHQNQWVELLKSLGDPEELLDVHPIPDSFPDEVENQEFNYAFLSTNAERQDDPGMPWTEGESPDGEGTFSYTTQHDIEGAPRNVDKADPQTFNEPAPQDED
ncbi:manganese catalase family protein (plasmid) [Halorarum halophilum]|uniref:Manganese catalase family protein n=1 Tax=Halorarum halophilum TaxID=2743090 RepID=A0A7D5GED4_9EURY|nr:manganese catalase family protein [Halobaculum halophilum]QLG29712.1 manganese catalase family protein [Halobaculum halophilum]